MSSPKELPLQKLQFYVTTPYTCGYLPRHLAQSLIASPHHLVDKTMYSELISQGFRRSGKFAYRPHCENCQQCVPIRIPVNQFNPTRSQKRALKQHSNLTTTILPLAFQQSHYDLYAAYQAQRHAPDDNQDQPSNNDSEKNQYQQFLCQSNIDSIMVEFKDQHNQVKIVSVIDLLDEGTSAVYTFYDATQTKASYGTHAIMWLLEWTKNHNLPYVYLGYWIAKSQKMAYKSKFNPQEKYQDGQWTVNQSTTNNEGK
ncbi:MAG: arginyltransferase [Methylophilaceae bacterium]|nr:arginyltransferase [Methylophilaceae bacterium]MDG1820408.1 arginyltransferase [Methylophilaceae bacterium]